MTMNTFSNGPALVKVGSSSLGYTRNGVEHRMEAFFVNVPGDELGGDDGPPIEVQYMGEIARIRVELTKWDSSVADSVAARIKGASTGVPGAAGTFLFGTSKTYSISITGNFAWTFPNCIPRGLIEINKGSKYSVLVLEFEAYKDSSGNLYTTS